MLLAIGTCAPVFLYDMHHDNLEEIYSSTAWKRKKKALHFDLYGSTRSLFPVFFVL